MPRVSAAGLRADSAERELGDVIGEVLDRLVIVGVVSAQSLEDRLGVVVGKALGHEASDAVADELGVGLRAEKLPNEFSNQVIDRSDAEFDDEVHGGSRFDHFAGNQFQESRWPPGAQQVSEHGSQEGPQSLVGRSRGVHLQAQDWAVRGSEEMFGDGEIEVLLVAKVIVDGGVIGLGTAADLAKRGVAIAEFAKDVGGGLEESSTGFKAGEVASHGCLVGCWG